ncbi:hypothetical protein FLONG3_4069 [Fusarium longipes]|uniref:Uncharacterized protein n=1 Tax=Fusarium longipes TaxID=694270 RepID=A0A395T0N0_9HYPO|nr:hypothetical protein FLONG3_4069 [Fusarium longipes]
MDLPDDGTKIVIPGLEEDAHATSFVHIEALKKFGRKWYAAGVQAGIAQAGDECHTTAESEGTRDIIIDLISHQENLNKQVKELEAFKDVAIGAREKLSSTEAAMASVIKSSERVVPQWLIGRLTSVMNEMERYRLQCSEKIDKASHQSKKRRGESHESEGEDGGSSNKRKRSN